MGGGVEREGEMHLCSVKVDGEGEAGEAGEEEGERGDEGEAQVAARGLVEDDEQQRREPAEGLVGAMGNEKREGVG